ncbi:16S rRNA (cytosine(1402)-N(4))-methyltransferase RsmH [Alkalilimnicola sp. S0819]|uniref:16S rRNA (cytosine(1402)-N(4))-methyltransferase RsmH n=1 Tax=Alkalilimnicola sp. S0819 TaxID=2613922 RepID=UPI0012622879|nr:16S rRNA (cytosine(1402)-N(4))-methyltransferase RsmH [Alkalilimnicola sp. S0819]KAB7623849.1 16S rRNA (cytosine(1402)-N(4))-methyltransferase RsmH [Alkalilimnicola sp. S0819]MPQ16725.1 16S rRNA (cytosine(1402)-N(4))-methyltransferase RsmH [Alkalilimnicola sp. S0819]
MMNAPNAHKPVLLEESIEALAIKPDGLYVDGTFGRGGHAERILAELNERGRLWLVDKDEAALARARERYGNDPRCRIYHGSFGELPVWAAEAGVCGRIDGILLDLGVSSPQLDDPERGFSFLRDGPLDMRMDRSRGLGAADWVAAADEREIVRVLRDYGEERFARRIARALVEAREAGQAPRRTSELANLIAAAVPTRERHKNPATRSFQAIRIEVNNELEDLRVLLAATPELLGPGGRLAVISFHSLEDRIVKRFMRGQSSVGHLPPGVPVVPDELKPKFRLAGKARRAGEAELQGNPRARSAVLRVAERLA